MMQTCGGVASSNVSNDGEVYACVWGGVEFFIMM